MTAEELAQKLQQEKFSDIKNYVPNSYSLNNKSINSASAQNANWLYAKIFIYSGEDKDFSFSIKDGQFCIKKDLDGEWCLYDHNSTIVAKGEDNILRRVKEERLKDASYLYSLNTVLDQSELKGQPLQQIFYGAPGTGKSNRIKRDTAGKSVIRTTFHPDSDYSTFVGAYKPVMEEADVRVVPVVLNNGASFDQNNGTLKEKRISYKFVKQAFLKAYLGAWKKYAEAEESAEPQFLVIEEINRGNCAQIFGDLFQLLDRNDENGFSTYPIDADTDLQKEIEKAFKEEKDGESDNPYKLSNDIYVEGVVEDYSSNYDASLSEDIQEGRVLLLPPNLYIWATMNTSDQSLFPIDSAFKRRWAWDYVKITDGKKGWMIQGADYSCDWWTFIREINKKIAAATSSDDKKIGYYFCKAKNNTTCIDEKLFVSKVIFYLWNDVFKDNDNSIFKVTESSGEPSFDDFYQEKNGEIVPNSFAVKQFLINVVGEDSLQAKDTEDDDENAESRKFSYNGTEMSLKEICKSVVSYFVNENPQLTTGLQIQNAFNDACPGFATQVIKTEEEYQQLDGMKSQSKNWQALALENGVKIYYNTQWRAKKETDNFLKFVEYIKQNGWGSIQEL